MDCDVAFVGGKRVIEVLDTWTVIDKWWAGHDEKIERDYAELVLENGDRVTMVREKGEKWERLK